MDAFNTVCEKCPYVEMRLCPTVQQCPNYCENIWQNGQTQEVKIVKDCSPKRQLIQSQHNNTRIEWLQKSIEDLRNKNESLESSLKTLICQSQMVIKAIEEKMSKEPLKISSEGVVNATDI